jgi:hypothetical protein
MKKLFFLFFTITSGVFFGQSNDPGANGLNISLLRSEINNAPNESINNRFYSESWLAGQLEIKNESEILQDKINYDLVTGELHIVKPKEKKGFVVLDKNVLGFVLKAKKGKVHFIRKEKNNFIDNSIDRNFFLNPFPNSEKQYLILDLRRVINESKIPTDGFTDIRNVKKYKERTYYYILNSNEKYEKVKLSKKHILEALSDKRNELSKYIKTNNLKMKNLEDVVKLLHYYHSL